MKKLIAVIVLLLVSVFSAGAAIPNSYINDTCNAGSNSFAMFSVNSSSGKVHYDDDVSGLDKLCINSTSCSSG